MQVSFFNARVGGRRRRMSHVARAASLLCLVVLATACSNDGASRKAALERQAARNASASGGKANAPRAGMPMPPVQTAQQTAADEGGWTLLDGRRAKLSDFRGQVLVLDFYATYCPPCREEIPHLNALQRRYAGEGVQVVGLNVGGEEDYPKVARFIEELGGVAYALGNPDEGFSQPFFTDNTSIPQTYVFDRRGRLVRRFVGFDPSMPAELEAAIKTALETKAD